MEKSLFQATITKALKRGGEVLLDYFGKVKHIRVKENLSSVVSEADIASETVILDQIGKDFPGHNIISEEYGYIFHDSPFTWIVDPLDGTSNFVAGLPWFGVLVAILKDHVPVAAGAYIPIGGHMYYAEEGEKAYLDGRLGAAINQHEKIWDIAALWLIIKEAGGIMTGLDGKALDFRVGEKDYSRDFAIVAANSTLHGEIMKLLPEK